MSFEEEVNLKFGHRLRVRACGIQLLDNKILLVKHLNIGSTGIWWAPPGGGLDFGESVHGCLKREFFEETGIQISVNELLCVYEFLQPPLHAIELFFSVSVIKGHLTLGKDPEMLDTAQIINEVRYLSLQEIKSLNPSSVHSILYGINDLDELKKTKFNFRS
jgi:8-oxo-dGTP diphosphatase